MGGKSLYLDCLEMQSVLALQLNLGVSNDCVIVFLYTYQCLAFYNLFIFSIVNQEVTHRYDLPYFLIGPDLGPMGSGSNLFTVRVR